MSAFDVIVIGTGITGLTAAKAAAQRGLKTAVVESMMFGGLVININELEPAPASAPASGTEFASNLMMEISEQVENISATVTALTREANGITVATDAGNHSARAVIIASGAKLKRLGIPGEGEFEGRGVSQCADCDGPMYKDQEVVVVGGGDSALQEALVLSQFCRRVHLVHRGTKFSGSAHLIEKVAAQKNILPIWQSVAEEVRGSDAVTAVRIKNSQGASSEIPSTGFFAYVGLEPTCEFAPGEIKRDERGFLMTDAALATGMAGVYAAGAVRSGYGGLLEHAIADGQTAVASACAGMRK
jgi:thioredoxin reductase (NADPH)